MSIPKDEYTQRLFQNIDQVSSPEKKGQKKQEAGVKAYNIDKMGAARKFFAKKMGVEYETADGKIVYLDKKSLSKFLERNHAISSAKEFNPETCIDQLKNLHTPIAAKAGAAFKDGNFRISEADLKAVCKGLGMNEQKANTFISFLAAYRTESAVIDSKKGTLKGSEPVGFLVEKGDESGVSKDLVSFLTANCKPEPMMRPTLMLLLKNLKGLAKP